MKDDEYRETVLKCPFCNEFPEPPGDVKTPFGGAVEGGRCSCGAIYVLDRTGRMLGEAFSEALAYAFDWDYDAAFSAPEGFYEETVIRFNQRGRKYLMGEGDFKDRFPKFYFIKRKQ